MSARAVVKVDYRVAVHELADVIGFMVERLTVDQVRELAPAFEQYRRVIAAAEARTA